MTKLNTNNLTSTDIHNFSVFISGVSSFKKLYLPILGIFLLSNLAFATNQNANMLPSKGALNAELSTNNIQNISNNNTFIQHYAGEGYFYFKDISFNNNQESDFPIPVYVYMNISNNPYLTAKKPNL